MIHDGAVVGTGERLAGRPSEVALGHPFDAAVVGAGPAGALAARQLALAGLSVLLIEKAAFPRDKVCGCCLNAAAGDVLSRVGLAHLLADLGANPIERLDIATTRGRASLPVRAVALSRAVLDLGLVREAIAAGVRFLPCTVASLDAAGNLHVRSTGAGERRAVHARVVLVADGLAGTTLNERSEMSSRVVHGGRIGAAAILPASVAGYARGTIHMTIGARGYVGAVRLEDQQLNLAAALDPGFIRDSGGPGPAIESLLDAGRMPSLSGLSGARFHATPTLTRCRPVLETDRVLILGDAAGYVEPFTGEGIAWALASAVAVVPAVLAKCAGPRGVADSWARIHKQGIARRQGICRAVAWALRRPRVADAIVRTLAVFPVLARPLLGRVALPYAAPEPAP